MPLIVFFVQIWTANFCFFSVSGSLRSRGVRGRICSEQPNLEVMITQHHIGHYFKVIQLRMEQGINQKLVALDLTAAQGKIIGYLTHAKQPLCARDVEQAFGLSHPTVSGLLSRMESKGFVELRPDPEDKRVKRIFLLEKGMSCSRQIVQSIRENEERMMQGFSETEKVQFRAMLERAISNLSEETKSSPPKREE